jgi:hypothetical protein
MSVEKEIQAMVDRETEAWNRQDGLGGSSGAE